MDKKNKLVDFAVNRIFPPEESIVPQLSAIRTNAASAAKVFENTKDLRSIFPNLDAMQHIINYLRGAPIPEAMKPAPEDTLKPVFTPLAKGFSYTCTYNKQKEYDVSIIGFGVVPKVNNELFGEIENASQITLKIPVTCGKVYLVSQENPALEYYKDDPYIQFYESDETWVKEKEYLMEEDYFEYAFLVGEGRSYIRIAIYADYEDPIIFNISAHAHYKEEEPIPQPEYEGVTLRTVACKVTKVDYVDGTTYYDVYGVNLNPKTTKPSVETYGELDFNAIELFLNIPVICGDEYKVTQFNPVLKHFAAGNSEIKEDAERGYYIKGTYIETKKDVLKYSFLAENGRQDIIIYLQDKKGTVWKYIINVHIHFQED